MISHSYTKLTDNITYRAISTFQLSAWNQLEKSTPGPQTTAIKLNSRTISKTSRVPVTSIPHHSYKNPTPSFYV